MTTNIEALEELLESSEKIVRKREASEDRKNVKSEFSPKIKSEYGNGDHMDVDDPKDEYTREREANDRRRSRRSAGEEADGNSSDTRRANGLPNRAKVGDPFFVDLEGDPRRAAQAAAERAADREDRPRSRGERERGSDRDRDRDRLRGGDNYVPLGAVDSWRPGSDNNGRDRQDRSSRPGSSGDDRRRSGRDRSRSPRGGRYNRRDDRQRSPPPRRSGDRGYGDKGGRGGRGGPRNPEPTDDERDRRTVFVMQLSVHVRTKELHAFFTKAGEVVEAQIVKDRQNGRSKGVGYVEFKQEESVQKAIDLTGQKLKGVPIIAQLTEAEKNRQARTTESSGNSTGVPFHRLYVGNIHFNVTEEDLKEVFKSFGELEFIQLQKEEFTNRSKGYGFVQYHSPAAAKEALEQMNNFDLAGRNIRVGLGNDKFTNESTQNILKTQRFNESSSFSGMGGRGSYAGGNANFDRASNREAEKTGGASALDDSDVGGVNFNNYSRDSLMKKLARTEDAEPKVQPRNSTVKKAPLDQNNPPPSRCLVLKNLFSQAQEAVEPNWQAELKTDVKDECEKSYGRVLHLDLVLDNDDGEVYIKFDTIEAGKKAWKGLNGRMFGRRMVSADYMIEAMYNANFPKAKNL